MNKDNPFELPMTVRGYELDSFGHVNNAVYVQYFEHCRWMALKELGGDWASEEGPSIVVRSLQIDYEAPATVFDEIVGRLWVKDLGHTSVTFGQELVRRDNERPIAAGEVVAVCIDHNGRPRRMPDRWKELLSDG